MLLSTKEVAKMLRMKADTVAKWRKQDKGPPYYDIEGKILYDADELMKWLKERREEPRKKRKENEERPRTKLLQDLRINRARR